MRIKHILTGLVAFNLWIGLLTPFKSQSSPFIKGKMTLLEAIEKISKQYDVYFTFDMTLVSKVEVDYEQSLYNSAEDALVRVLKGTGLKYKFFDHRFVIIYKDDAKGLESLKKMSKHLSGLIREGENKFEPIGKKEMLIVRTLPERSVLEDLRPVAFSVEGTVVNNEGEALVGVTIQVKGANKATTTDANGHFSLTDIEANAVLVISYVGFETQEVRVGGQANLKITMVSADQALEQVVVVGYGTKSKVLNSASISSISVKDLNIKSSVKSTGELLQGKAPGVMVRNTDGAPGTEPVIRIRGMNSILGNNGALIVIDGFQRGSLRGINPNDIESIDILKDASATAIYGSEGANGVIIITTKHGSVGEKPTLSFNYNVTRSKMAKELPVIRAGDWERYINAIELMDNLDRDPIPIFSDQEITEMDEGGGYNWQEMISQVGISSDYGIALGGGIGGHTSYRVSGSFYDNKGVLKNSSYKRYTFGLRLNSKVTEWLKVGLNFDKNNEVTSGLRLNTQTDNPIGGALHVPPIMPPFNEDGNYFGLEDISFTKWSQYGPSVSTGNPMASVNEVQMLTNNVSNNLFGNIVIGPISNLSLRIEAGLRETYPTNRGFLNNNTYEGIGANGSGTFSQSLNRFFQNSNILTYTNSFGKHNIDLTGVFEQKHSDGYNASISNSDFAVQSLGYNSLGGGTIQTASSSSSGTTILSYVGRIEYNYDSKYLLNISVRKDGASVFGANNKWGTFPSFSVGWNLGKERFIENLSFFNTLKLRGGYGLTGNQAIGPYGSLASVALAGRYPYNGGEGTVLGYALNRAENPRLKWESTKQYNLGIDLSVLNGNLGLTADYYVKNTRNLLQYKQTPDLTGIGSVLDNLGRIRNKGFELGVNYSYNSLNFNMNHNLNFSTNQTKIVDLGPGVEMLGYSAGGSGNSVNDPLIFLFVGQPWGQIYSYKVDGTWGLKEEQEAKRYGQLPGNLKYRDLNDDGIIDSRDRMILGNVFPKFEVALNSNFNYGAFFLSFEIQGVEGNKIFNVTRAGTMMEVKWTDRWTPDNQNTIYPQIDYWDAKKAEGKLTGIPSTIAISGTMRNGDSRWVEDGSYIRMKTITLGYNFKNLTKKYKMGELSVYISGKNLFTITKYTGYNPEVSSFGGDDKTIGTSFYDYPITRDINIGFNLNF